MSTDKPVSVEIYGETYNVRGEGDPEYLARLAELVDERMHDIAAQVSTADVKKIAILAALNLADELSRHVEEGEATMERWMNRTRQMVKRLERELNHQ